MKKTASKSKREPRREPPNTKKATKKKAISDHTTRTKNRSKVKPPACGVNESKLIAFRAPMELKRQLDKEPNVSEAILDALKLYYKTHRVCPRCNGTGHIERKK